MSPGLMPSSVAAVVVLAVVIDLSGANEVAMDSKVRSEKTPVLETGKLDEGEDVDMTDEKTQAKMLDGYRDIFKMKRKQQIRTAESLVDKDSYAKQYRLVKVLLDEVFRTLRKAQTNLTEVEIAELPVLPVGNKTVLDSLLSVWENTALLGDVLLRLPDISHRLIDGHKVRMSILEWAIDLCFSSPVYDDTQQKQLELMLQETKLAKEIDPTYENPYADATIRRKQAELTETRELQEAALNKLRRRKERQPKLSRARRFEL